MDASAKKAKTPAKAPESVMQADTNKDGKVSKGEYLSFRKQLAQQNGRKYNAKGVTKAFNKWDKNQDGFLTPDECQMSAAPAAEGAEAVQP